MFDFHKLLEEFSGRGIGVVLGLILGSVITGLIAYWRRRRERRRILLGDARDTVVIHQQLVEAAEVSDGAGRARVPTTLRTRCIGQGQLRHVVPNAYLAAVLLHRAHKVTPRDTLISMEGAEGSFLLETLTNFVCDRAANAPFEHELFVMAPCCEPVGLAQHQPITVLLIAVADLALFEKWTRCRDVRVEHSSDGARVLTLMDMARRFREEQEKIISLRKAGQRTQYVETMYVLDLPLDKRSAAVPTKKIPWGRFEKVLAQKNLE
jgi:hypothetical protein